MQEPRSKSKTDEKSSSKTSLGSNCILVYRGVIRQSSGEDWTNANLSLETANPTFDLKDEPNLAPWTIQEPNQYPPTMVTGMPLIGIDRRRSRSRSSSRRSPRRRHRRDSSSRRRYSRSRSRERVRMPTAMPAMPPAYQPPPAPVRHREAEVVPSGHTDWQTNATFRIAGRMTVPSDNEDRNVVIASIALDAAMNWVCVPKLDARVKVKVSTSTGCSTISQR